MVVADRHCLSLGSGASRPCGANLFHAGLSEVLVLILGILCVNFEAKRFSAKVGGQSLALAHNRTLPEGMTENGDG